jgi:3'-phosphoadenosine 5'-phosphosulfate sulfotransferase (PAPS reductase)/FAD synthetase
MRTLSDLAQKQHLPLEQKIILSQQRIREWYEHWDSQVYISTSGGKDSIVLTHLVRSLYPNTVAVYCNTGLEFPEVRQSALQTLSPFIILKPKINFKTVLETYGYPVVSKEQSQFLFEIRTTSSEDLYEIRMFGNAWGRGKISDKWRYLIKAPFLISYKCCDVMKKQPFIEFEKKTNLHGIVGTNANESTLRKSNWIRYGCNNFTSKRTLSAPLSFWLEEDIWSYIHKFNLSYPNIYDKGWTQTGCMFCCFGVHLEPEPNRFQRMKLTHPQLYKYCMEDLGIDEVLTYMDIPH